MTHNGMFTVIQPVNNKVIIMNIKGDIPYSGLFNNSSIIGFIVFSIIAVRIHNILCSDNASLWKQAYSGTALKM